MSFFASSAMVLTAPGIALAQSRSDRWSAPPIWRGAYLGLHGSLENTSFEFTMPQAATLSAADAGLGIHAGYSWQLGALVAGFEVDGTKHGLKAQGVSGGMQYASETTLTMSARGRLGLAFDNVLIYATLGGAAGYFETNIQNAVTRLSTDDLTTGLVYGAGVEYQFMPSLSARFELLHTDYNTLDIGSGSAVLNPDTTSVRAGLTLRFN